MSELKGRDGKNRLAFNVRNPCNEFLVEYLVRLRQK
jgi:hypothetical protein